MLVLTEEEFGALAGAVSTEFRRLQDLTDAGRTAVPLYIGERLRNAWGKLLKAWHPDVAEEALAGSDWVTLFDPSFTPPGAVAPAETSEGDAEVY
ncbi:uncharacterized protein METZ01_LOCUS492236, partial [marine metagenome]